MSKFNKKAEREIVINDMGEKAYKLSPKEELVSTVLTTFVEHSYYETKNEILQRVIKAINKCDITFVAKLAIYARLQANMRSISHVLAGEVARRVSGLPWGARFYNRICVRPDDVAEILSYYKAVVRNGGDKKIPNSMKKGFANFLGRIDAYQIDKYKMNSKDFSLKDLIRLFHPKPTGKNAAEAYKRLVAGESLGDLYTSKILDREKAEAMKHASNKFEAKAEAIRDVLEANAENTPIMNLLRNLKDIVEYTPEKVDEVVKILTNREKILHSKLLPFRFASAYEAVLGSKKSDIKFEDNKQRNKLLAAIETAIEYSVENIPKLLGRVAILIDHSGSMRGDIGGSGKVSPFSKVTSSTIANLFGAMLMHSQDNVYLGLFGDRLISVEKLDRKKGVLQNHLEIHRLGADCGPATENGIYTFFYKVIKERIPVDHIFVFSDMVIGSGNGWYGNTSSTRSGQFNTLFKEFRLINPHANVVSVNIRDTKGATVFDRDLGVTQMAGWSDKIFSLMTGFSRGYADLVKEIEEIEL